MSVGINIEMESIWFGSSLSVMMGESRSSLPYT